VHRRGSQHLDRVLSGVRVEFLGHGGERRAGESGAVGRVLRISGDDSDGPSKGDASESAAADGRLNTCLISGSFQYPRLPLTA
jgi:hypothetical protein